MEFLEFTSLHTTILAKTFGALSISCMKTLSSFLPLPHPPSPSPSNVESRESSVLFQRAVRPVNKSIYSQSSRKRTPSGSINRARNWSSPLTRMCKYRVTLDLYGRQFKQGFVEAVVSRRSCLLTTVSVN